MSWSHPEVPSYSPTPFITSSSKSPQNQSKSSKCLPKRNLVATKGSVCSVLQALHNCSNANFRILQVFACFADVHFFKFMEFSKCCGNFARFFQISPFWGADSHQISTEIRGLKRMTEVCCRRPEMLQRSCKRRPPFSENLPRKSFENPQTVHRN